MRINYEFKYENFPQGLDLRIFTDNFVSEPGVRLFFSKAGV